METFTPVPDWLARRTDLGPGEKLVYSRLARYWNASGVAYPSHDTLARELGMSVRTVKRHIEKLKVMGLIDASRRGKQQTNLYVMGQSGTSVVPSCQSEVPICPSEVPTWPTKIQENIQEEDRDSKKEEVVMDKQEEISGEVPTSSLGLEASSLSSSFEHSSWLDDYEDKNGEVPTCHFSEDEELILILKEYVAVFFDTTDQQVREYQSSQLRRVADALKLPYSKAAETVRRNTDFEPRELLEYLREPW